MIMNTISFAIFFIPFVKVIYESDRWSSESIPSKWSQVPVIINF